MNFHDIRCKSGGKMLKEIIHVGVTVTDLNRSIEFYQNLLGLSFKGKLVMEGEKTDKLFNMDDCQVEVAYLNGSDHIMAPSIELLQFLNPTTISSQSDLHKTSISEICFRVKDIDSFYKRLLENGVDCISEPQVFDFTENGFGKSKAMYFKDPDGIILEAIEELS